MVWFFKKYFDKKQHKYFHILQNMLLYTNAHLSNNVEDVIQISNDVSIWLRWPMGDGYFHHDDVHDVHRQISK